MINVSNEWKSIVADSDIAPDFTAKETIVLLDGTVLEVTEADIVTNGVKCEDAVSGSNTLQIGSAVVGEHTVILNNIEGKFSNYDFTGAVSRPYSGLRLSSITEWIKKGVYNASEYNAVAGTVIIVSKTNMQKLEVPFLDVVATFPISAFNLLYATCLHCGITLSILDFTNKDFMINRRPSDETITCREVVAWIAQLGGNFARMNVDGYLELKWYDMDAFKQEDNINGGTFDSATPYATGNNVDGGNFTDYNSGDSINGGTFLNMNRYHHIYNIEKPTIGTDDVVVTGIRVKAKGIESDYGETYLYGTEGYVLSIDDNPFIQEGMAQAIATVIGLKIVGMRFRTMSLSALEDPSREAGDVAKVSDQDGNVYHAILTGISTTFGKLDTVRCEADSPMRNSSGRSTPQTKFESIAKEIANQKINAYDLAVQQLNSLMTNAMGYYPTVVKLPDGSQIDYMHDKPTLAESVIVWKKSIDGFATSIDGGVTWISGQTADGNIIAKTLAVIGINAEWIKVLTSFTVGELFSVNALGKLIASDVELRGKITADSGKIGPYAISSVGLISKYITIFDNGVFPLIQLDKFFEEIFSYDTKVPGAQRAKYETGKLFLGAFTSGGIRNEIEVLASDDGSTEEKGIVKITKFNESNSELISTVRVSDNGTIIKKYVDGVISAESSVSPNGGLDLKKYEYGLEKSSISARDNAIIMQNNGFSFGIVMDAADGKVYMNASGININGTDF